MGYTDAHLIFYLGKFLKALFKVCNRAPHEVCYYTPYVGF